ncbi:GDP-mannose 4,6-dehydratase [Microbacterium schleiferi]|uniref:GDP-mannose 4,6-dehydratase n=1 Tax=Microbacterium schleiferi TaxID=69362 RepID=A0A7S8MZG2_9MICO|nr:NAD-dependent epimerase/dehydratase family protein [Microbacterium schleiferi]QPE05205.1 GDP-mannose 4,6-dehydratase [Microbacterium schleiferi]
MRAVVTGAAGFIGSHLTQRLISDGHEVVGIDNLSDYYDPRLKKRNLSELVGKGFTLVRADLTQADLSSVLDGTDVVYHLAGQPGVRASWGESFDEYVNANVIATQRLLEEALRVRGIRIVYASSSSVYGDAESYPTNENVLPRPRSPYGVTKLAAEHLCRLYAANFGLETVSLRFFTVYGPRQRPDMAFGRFLQATLEDTEIVVYGSGEQIRDFTYVGDIVDALAAVGSGEVTPGTVYNVSGGGSHSINEVLELIADVTERTPRVRYTDVARGDVSRTKADVTSITTQFGWMPRIGLREGLTRHWEWVLSQAGHPRSRADLPSEELPPHLRTATIASE